jgi:hypothetical protein
MTLHLTVAVANCAVINAKIDGHQFTYIWRSFETEVLCFNCAPTPSRLHSCASLVCNHESLLSSSPEVEWCGEIDSANSSSIKRCMEWHGLMDHRNLNAEFHWNSVLFTSGHSLIFLCRLCRLCRGSKNPKSRSFKLPEKVAIQGALEG